MAEHAYVRLLIPSVVSANSGKAQCASRQLAYDAFHIRGSSGLNAQLYCERHSSQRFSMQLAAPSPHGELCPHSQGTCFVRAGVLDQGVRMHIVQL